MAADGQLWRICVFEGRKERGGELKENKGKLKETISLPPGLPRFSSASSAHTSARWTFGLTGHALDKAICPGLGGCCAEGAPGFLKAYLFEANTRKIWWPIQALEQDFKGCNSQCLQIKIHGFGGPAGTRTKP